MSTDAKETAARTAILRAAIVCVLGVALAGTTSRSIGGWIVVVGWVAMVFALHAYGRAGS